MKNIIILVLLSSMVLSYPVVISEQGYNHTQNKQFVEHYSNYSAMKWVDKIYFLNENWMTNHPGYFFVRWNINHDCYDTTIWLVGNEDFIMKHELCHIQYHCIDKKNKVNETHADSCELYEVKNGNKI